MTSASEKSSGIKLGKAPIGVKFSPAPEKSLSSQTFSGASFCEAVHLADGGANLLLTPESITTCRWSPVVLGLKPPDPNLDLKVEYRVPHPNPAVLVAPLKDFPADYPPDVVLVRAVPAEMKKIITVLGAENTAAYLTGLLDRSALSVFSPVGAEAEKRRIQAVNRTLARLNRSESWRDFTKWIFKNQLTTYVFDLLLDRYLANMSMCRNSAVIPHVTGKANVSFFCTGGIAWGLNNPEHLTCGIPYRLFDRIESTISES